ncbi:hypothetical protein [Anaerotaenia torta]
MALKLGPVRQDVQNTGIPGIGKNALVFAGIRIPLPSNHLLT